MGYPVVPENSNNSNEHRRLIARAVNGILKGKMNVAQSITFNPSATTTVINDARIGAASAVLLTPLTANAATAYVAGWYVTNQLPGVGTTSGSLTLNHASNAAIDQNFTLTILG